jgi:beta-1,4-mannosyl-glycoprotein beta-1,4-N-acetylglucosaminyltransferase
MGWAGTKGVRYKNFTTAQELRQARAGKTLSGAGWHFSYIGGEQRIADKLAAFSHQELKGFNNHENITKTLRENKDLFNRNEQFNVIEIDDTFPKYIRENQDKFGHLIK